MLLLETQEKKDSLHGSISLPSSYSDKFKLVISQQINLLGVAHPEGAEAPISLSVIILKLCKISSLNVIVRSSFE